MKLRLTPLMSRAAAVAFAAGAFGLIYVIVVGPMISAANLQSEQVAILRRQAHTMEGFAAAAPQYEAVMKRLAANPELRQLAFQAPQPSVAVAQMQSQLSQLVTSAGATIMSSQALPDMKERGLTKLTVTTTFQGEMKAIMAVLDGIGRARPLHFLEKLNIRDPDGEWAVPVSNPEANKLQVELVVAAYMRQ